MRYFSFSQSMLLTVLVSFILISFIGNNAALAEADTAATSDSSSGDSWFGRWMKHVTEIQEAQPHWVTPLVTVTPRLEQEVRLDYIDQTSTSNGPPLINYGNGKGLELIPVDNVEVIFNAPPYLAHDSTKLSDGFGDVSALVKYRILSAPAAQGDYIVSAFLGLSVPTGSYKNGSPATILTPTIAGGKGCGPLDIQSTLGVTIPDVPNLSHTILWNTTVQYHLLHIMWPEVEFNYSHFTGGTNVGQTQAFITPGLMIGRFPIHDRIGFTIGGGMQIAATSFHTYDHAWVISARLPF